MQMYVELEFHIQENGPLRPHCETSLFGIMSCLPCHMMAMTYPQWQWLVGIRPRTLYKTVCSSRRKQKENSHSLLLCENQIKVTATVSNTVRGIIKWDRLLHPEKTTRYTNKIRL
jgi:hypothetical protein